MDDKWTMKVNYSEKSIIIMALKYFQDIRIDTNKFERTLIEWVFWVQFSIFLMPDKMVFGI